MASFDIYEGNVLGQALENPDRRIPASCATEIEDLLIDLGISSQENDLPISPEYWKGDTQYNRIIHAYEKGKSPHLVLKGRNIFNRAIRARDGTGNINEVEPGKEFKTHVLVDINN